MGQVPLAGIGRLHFGQPNRDYVFHTCAGLLRGLSDLHVFLLLQKGSCLRETNGLVLLFIEVGSRNKMNKSRSLMWGFRFPFFLFVTIMFLFFVVAKCSVFEETKGKTSPPEPIRE